MAVSWRSTSTVAVVCIAVACTLSAAFGQLGLSDARLAELSLLRQDTQDGVLSFSDEQFSKYAVSDKRPYHLAVFLTAHQMLDNKQLMLAELRREFGLAATAFRKVPQTDEIFFVQLVFEEARTTFQGLGITSLPYVFHISPDLKLTSAKMEVPKADRMDLQSVTAKYPWPAEAFVEFLARRTGLSAAPIEHPSLLKSPTFRTLLVLGLIGMVYSAYKVYHSVFIRKPWVWAAGSLLVYWFSTSGAMFNIIRGMPMTMRTREGTQYFLNQRGAQLGAEGFIMGSTYIAFSLCIALITYGVPRMESKGMRQAVGTVAFMAATYIVYKIFSVYMWKSGYQFVSYL